MRSILRERTPGSTVLLREILSCVAILAENSPEHHLKYYTIRIIPVKLCNSSSFYTSIAVLLMIILIVCFAKAQPHFAPHTTEIRFFC